MKWVGQFDFEDQLVQLLVSQSWNFNTYMHLRIKSTKSHDVFPQTDTIPKLSKNLIKECLILVGVFNNVM